MQLRVLMVNHNEEFLGHAQRLWHSNQGKRLLEAVVNFSFEAFLCILDYVELGVTDPRINKTIVDLPGIFELLLTRIIIFNPEELLCTIRSRLHVNDSLITSITKLDR